MSLFDPPAPQYRLSVEVRAIETVHNGQDRIWAQQFLVVDLQKVVGGQFATDMVTITTDLARQAIGLDEPSKPEPGDGEPWPHGSHAEDAPLCPACEAGVPRGYSPDGEPWVDRAGDPRNPGPRWAIWDYEGQKWDPLPAGGGPEVADADAT